MLDVFLLIAGGELEHLILVVLHKILSRIASLQLLAFILLLKPLIRFMQVLHCLPVNEVVIVGGIALVVAYFLIKHLRCNVLVI